MAARDFSDWVAIIKASDVQGRARLSTRMFGVARARPMTTNQTDVPRLVGADVGGGSALVEDTNDGSDVSMFTGLFTGKHTLDEAEQEDASADSIASINREWLTSFFTAYDNAALGTTAARSATLSDKIPFTSVYKAVITADSETGYSASANHQAVAASAFSGSAAYLELSETLGYVEQSDFWVPESVVVFADPSLRQTLRDILDADGRPIFMKNTTVPNLLLGGGDQVEVAAVDTLFDHPIVWTRGAKTSNNYSMSATGSKLIAFINAQYLVRGDRIGPQGRFIPAGINTTALEHTVQHRARQGFVLTVPQAAGVLELT